MHTMSPSAALRQILMCRCGRAVAIEVMRAYRDRAGIAVVHQLIAERCGPDVAAEVMERYTEHAARYGRARRVAAARAWLAKTEGQIGPRYDSTRQIVQALLENAEAYIRGEWQPPRHGR